MNKLISPLLKKELVTAMFDCETQTAVPQCRPDVPLTEVNIDTTVGGFMTVPNIVSPSSRRLSPVSSQFPLPYYHSHPSALYNSQQESTLSSFPFLMKTNYPSTDPPYISLGSYAYSPTPVVGYTNSFEQYSFSTNNLSIFNSTTIVFNSATQPFALITSTADNGAITLPTSTNPLFLTTLLQSGTAFVLLFTQGVPYMVLSPFTTASQIFAILGSARETITVTTINGISFTCEVLFTGGTSRHYYTVTMFPSSNAVTVVTNIPGLSVTYTTGTPSSREYYYIFLFNSLPSSLDDRRALFTTFADNLINLPIIVVSDIGIDNTNNNVFVKYTYPVPTNSNNSSLMWIPPPTIQATRGLTQIDGISSFLALPNTNTNREYGVYLTSVNTISFYAVWPLMNFPPDFTYIFPNANRIVDYQKPLQNLNDLYELTTSMRIMVKNGNGSKIPYSTSLDAVNFWKTNMLKFRYDPTARGLRIDNLGNELGMISYFSYMLLSYLNLYFISQSGTWPTTSETFLLLNDQFYTNLVDAMIDTCFITDIASFYYPMQFMDFYTCTLTNIDYASPSYDNSAYYSRLGEALGYLWGSYRVRTIRSLSGPSIDLLTAMYSIISQSTPYLLRGECSPSSPSPVTFPILPWNGLYSTTHFGFSLDIAGKKTLGKSPDAVFIQSFLPFSPTSNQVMGSIIRQYNVQLMKILKCKQTFEGTVPIDYYYFGGWVDPKWVGYFLYLFDPSDRANTIITGSLDSELSLFIQSVRINYTLMALLMNYSKLE